MSQLIRDFPDHATSHEKSVTTGLVDKLGGFLSLTLCNNALALITDKATGLEKDSIVDYCL